MRLPRGDASPVAALSSSTRPFGSARKRKSSCPGSPAFSGKARPAFSSNGSGVNEPACQSSWPPHVSRVVASCPCSLRGAGGRGEMAHAAAMPAEAKLVGRNAFHVAAGTVKFFNPERGYGFIKPDDGGRDIFVHITAVERAGLNTLNEGQRLTFEIEADKKGKGPKAVELHLI